MRFADTQVGQMAKGHKQDVVIAVVRRVCIVISFVVRAPRFNLAERLGLGHAPGRDNMREVRVFAKLAGDVIRPQEQHGVFVQRRARNSW